MKFKKWFWGLFFILAGVLILLNALEIIISINITSLLLTVLLSALIIGSLIRANFTGLLIPLALIGIINAEALGITNITPWPILITAVMLSIGLEIIFHSHKPRRFNCSDIEREFGHEHFSEVVDEADADEIEYHVNFGSGVKYVNTDNFKKGYFTCRFGALKIYFDNAKVGKTGAEIVLDITLSGVELYIPKEWNLVIEANVNLSGIEEKNRHGKNDGPRVVLKGNVTLSGVEIIYI